MKLISAIISVIIILAAILILLYSASVIHAQEDPFSPMRNATKISAYGPSDSGVDQYGRAEVTTRSGERYEYLFENGGYFIKYRKYGDTKWILISNNQKFQGD